jgi:hypothetical protein
MVASVNARQLGEEQVADRPALGDSINGLVDGDDVSLAYSSASNLYTGGSQKNISIVG